VEAVDVVSFALAVVSLGFNSLVSDSMPAATAPVTWAVVLFPFFLSAVGAYAVSNVCYR
jgi:hypothetical protein